MNKDASTSSEKEKSKKLTRKAKFEERLCDRNDKIYDKAYARMKMNTCRTQPTEEVYMLDAPNFEISDNNTKWIDYVIGQLARQKISNQNANLVGQHHVAVSQTVRAWLFQVGLIVLCKEKGNVFPVVLTDCQHGSWYCHVVGEDNIRQFREKNMITNREEAKEAMKEITPKYNINGSEPNFYVIDDFREAMKYLSLSVHQCVEPGQFLEYQLSENPETVCLGRVIRNYRGLLVIWFGASIGERWIHISDPFLHAVGWSRDQTEKYDHFGQKIRLLNDLRNVEETLKTEAVPSFVFRNNYIPAHRLKEGDIMIAADHYSNGLFWSHVVNTTPPSNTFFHLAHGEHLLRHPDKRPCHFHIHHPRIFSVKKIKACGIQIRLPGKMHLNTDEPDVVAYKRVYSPNGRVLNDNCGVHHLFLTCAISKWEDAEQIEEQVEESEKTLRYVEVLRPVGFTRDKWQMVGAVVTAQKQNILRLTTATDKLPFYLHTHDPKIFHLGTAITMKLAVLFDPQLLDKKSKEKKVGRAINGFATF